MAGINSGTDRHWRTQRLDPRGTPLHPFLDSHRVLYFLSSSKLLKIGSNKGVDCYILRDLIGLI